MGQDGYRAAASLPSPYPLLSPQLPPPKTPLASLTICKLLQLNKMYQSQSLQ